MDVDVQVLQLFGTLGVDGKTLFRQLDKRRHFDGLTGWESSSDCELICQCQ